MALSILPSSYPQPMKVQAITSSETAQHVTSESRIKEFPSIFDRKVKPTEGEQFHIALVDDAKLFCVTTHRTIPMHTEQAEHQSLEEQGINHLYHTH